MAVSLNKGVFLVAGRRTPVGKYGGLLREVPPEDLFAVAAKGAFKDGGVSPHIVDTVNIGQINSLSLSGNSPRHAALKAGLPHSKPVLGLNKLSASAFHAIAVSAQEILLGSAQVSLAGGMECISSTPFLVRGARYGIPPFSNLVMEDWLHCSNFDSYRNLPLARAADIIADMYKIRREEADEFAVRSQKRWKAAHDKGLFDSEVVPVKVAMKGQEQVMDTDECPRPHITVEQLSRLPLLFKGGVTTAGNVCYTTDGAAAVVLASEEALVQHDLIPLSRLAGWASVGLEPVLLAKGALVAAKTLLDAAGMTIKDIDLVEIHETFAAQAVVSARELGVPDEKLNVNGGAIAIGHPPGATGARLVIQLTLELRRRQLKWGLATVCVAGGQGMALLVEAV